MLSHFRHSVIGNLQDDDEADTVGCCTLKVANVECIPPNKLKV
jgi:DNA topoisomerase-1